jgi:isopenicillin-N epimerase
MFGPDLLSHWLLDPAVTFLNHGCFGATPRRVLDAQTAWRQRLEARPVELLDRGRRELLSEPKRAVGEFIGADPDDFGFVTNATGGVNAVLRSLRFETGDEIVTTDHVYNAVQQTLRYIGRARGPKTIQVPVPLPVTGPDEVTAAIAAALTDRTRLVLIDHIGSSTGLVFPVKQVVDLCTSRGVDVLVDGAHGPGMIELDLNGLGAAYYTGNLHKWVCAPKGAAFLWVRPDRQSGVHPNTISHFLDEGFAEEFQWQGTRDITAWLCTPDAIDFMGQFGWDQVRRHNHQLAVWAQQMLSDRWQVPSSTPADGSMLGSLATLPLPGGLRERFADITAFQRRLYDRDRIEVPIIEWNDLWWVRVSCQVYNHRRQYERLGDAILEHATG